MKTLIRFWLFEEGKMKLSNLPFAIFMTFLGICVLIIIAYGASFLIGINLDAIADVSLVKKLAYKAFAGVLVLGILDGILFVLGLFVLAMKAPNNTN